MPGNVLYLNHKRDKGEIKMLMRCEVEEMYDEYRWECEEKGLEPKSLEDWWEELVEGI